MKNLFRNFLLLGVLLSISVLGFASTQTNSDQDNIWSDATEIKSSLQGERQIIPQAYRYLELDVEALQNKLQESPLRFTAQSKQMNNILSLPLYDGSWADFIIEEAPIMEEGLAAFYPNFKTYVGTKVDDPRTTARLDWTARGFHAMIYSPQGSMYIDPYSSEDQNHYISYHKKDFQKDDEWTCGVESSASKALEQDQGLNKSVSGDCQLRSYRLAVATTGEYTAFHGGATNAASAIVTTMNRVTGVYEIEFGVTFALVSNNNLLIYTNSATDPYSNGAAGTMLGENVSNINSVIGSANYDIGHVFGTNSGGVAYLGSVCGGSKAGGVTGSGSPVGDPFDIDYVAHEIGHQFGGNHTFNNSCGGNRNGSTAMEPGSGTTIMAYAGICAPDIQSNSDDHFHAISIQEVSNFITGNGNSCATIINTSNNPPVANAGPDYTIPISTPFTLQGTATDPDGDPLTSNWDQMDNEISTQSPLATSTNGPNFESLTPTPSLDRTIPDLSYILSNTNNQWEVLSSVSRTFDFRFMVRDNGAAYGCNDEDDATITVSNTSGPFLVNSPNTNVTWSVAETETVTWDPANTTAAPVSCADVDILLSLDGGLTYPIVLASAVPNDGSQDITVPNNPTNTARVKIVCSDNIFFDLSNSNFTIEFNGPDYLFSSTETSVAVCPGNDAMFNLDLDGFAGFSNTVVLSASGNPTGTNISFSNNSFVPTGSSILTVSNTAGLASGTYTITIDANSIGNDKSINVDLIVGAPALTNLNSPSDGANGVVLLPSLSWTANSTATGYDVSIATDPGMTNIVETGSSITNTFTPSAALSAVTTYYWQVTATNNCGPGPSSSVFTFDTETLTYCNTTGQTTDDEWIESIQVATISNNSGDNNGYQDFTNISTTMEPGQSYPVTLVPGYAGTNYHEYWKIWMDFNLDGNFDDATELVFDSGNSIVGTVTGNVVIPATASSITTTMRVSMKYDEASDPCETFQWGEVEDYTVSIELACTDSDNDDVCDAVDECPGSDDNLDTNSNGLPDDCEPARVSLKIYLEGAYSGSGSMDINLNTKGLLPSQHPYTAAPYNIPAASLTSVPTQMVDWVVVESRTSQDNSGTLEQKVGLLMSNGLIKDLDGISDLSFDLPAGAAYYFVVRHRNHLDVVTANPLNRNLTMSYDFTTNINQAVASKLKNMPDGSAALFAGDCNQDLSIQVTDKDVWRADPAQLDIYKNADMNMDGVIQTTDYDIWFYNKAVLGPSEIDY